MELLSLFISIVHHGLTHRTWSGSALVLVFKEDNKTLWKFDTSCLARKLDEFRLREHVGFPKGFRTVGHVNTVRQIIQKTDEYNQPPCKAFMDYEKVLDSIETWGVLDKACSDLKEVVTLSR